MDHLNRRWRRIERKRKDESEKGRGCFKDGDEYLGSIKDGKQEEEKLEEGGVDGA